MKIEEKLPVATVTQVRSEPPANAPEAAKSGTSQATRPGDTVSLSTDAAKLNKASEAIQQLPDIRAERVAEIKKEVDAGHYKVEARAVAEKMLMSMSKGVMV